MELRQAKLFINPAAGRWRGKKLAAKIRNYLHQRGLKSNAVFTRAPGDLVGLTRQAVLDGTSTIIVAGGDGTIFEAVNGLMQARELLAKDAWNKLQPTLGILPIGTGNDFIKAVNIPKDLKSACDYLLAAQPKCVDVAHIKTDDGNEAYFINNIGAGFDGKIGLTAQKIPVIRGIAVYILALIWHLIKGIPKPFSRFSTDGVLHEDYMTLVAISNGTTYGGTFNIAPDAQVDDGKLDCVFVPSKGRITVIPMLLQLMQAKHLKNPQVLFKQCEQFQIETDEPIVVIADGELVSAQCRKFDVSVIKTEFRLLLTD